MAAHPGWLQLRIPSGPLAGFPATLGAGERDAIALAEELRADALLIDGPAASKLNVVLYRFRERSA